MKFWNEDRTQRPAVDIGDLEKYMSKESKTGAGNIDQIQGENAPEENEIALAGDGSTSQLNNGNTTQGKAETTDQEGRAAIDMK